MNLKIKGCVAKTQFLISKRKRNILGLLNVKTKKIMKIQISHDLASIDVNFLLRSDFPRKFKDIEGLYRDIRKNCKSWELHNLLYIFMRCTQCTSTDTCTIALFSFHKLLMLQGGFKNFKLLLWEPAQLCSYDRIHIRLLKCSFPIPKSYVTLCTGLNSFCLIEYN